LEPSVIVARGRVRLRVWLIVGAVAVVAVLGGTWVWLRDSSLVRVEHVRVTGVSGPDAGEIRSALGLAARNMTTLDAHIAQLRTAAAPYPVVKDLQVSTQFPHGMRIHVIEQLPVGAIVAGGQTVAASADGTLLRDVPTASLPTIPLASLPGGSHVNDQTAREALTLLAGTPKRLEAKISQVTTSEPHGLVVQLRSGPLIYFGTATDLAAKWIAATEVLAAPGSANASYIDVSDPGRPAAGVGAAALAAAGLATGASSDSSASAGDTASSSGGDTSSSTAGDGASAGGASTGTPGD
jgi:cell division protein FtsQ